MKAIALASLAAVLVQPLVFALITAALLTISLLGGAMMNNGDLPRLFLQLGPISIYVDVVATAFVVVVGIPLFLVLKRMGKLRWRSILSAGFLAAAIPFAVIGFPLLRDSSGFSYGANWHGTYVQFVENGVYTMYGWLNYLEEIVRFGIHGLAGAAAFYLVWLRLHEPQQGVPADDLAPLGRG